MQKEQYLQRLSYPIDTFRRFEARWHARLEQERKSALTGASGPDMKARDRIDKVRRILETGWARRNVRGSLAIARRKEAEGVELRQHPQKPKAAKDRTPDESSTAGTS